VSLDKNEEGCYIHWALAFDLLSILYLCSCVVLIKDLLQNYRQTGGKITKDVLFHLEVDITFL
jgi:hypothetical protein